VRGRRFRPAPHQSAACAGHVVRARSAGARESPSLSRIFNPFLNGVVLRRTCACSCTALCQLCNRNHFLGYVGTVAGMGKSWFHCRFGMANLLQCSIRLRFKACRDLSLSGSCFRVRVWLREWSCLVCLA
jgi:hypothetical protein